MVTSTFLLSRGCSKKPFAVEQTGQFWDQVRQSRSFAVYVPADFLNPQMELIVLLAQPA